mmetsp:Transcript_25277/g.63632  ORF Transcript_25277/g.63632 Transcript_25277/m.63632 type:complete len:1009 (+) Transcript_25277:238-3264(+)
MLPGKNSSTPQQLHSGSASASATSPASKPQRQDHSAGEAPAPSACSSSSAASCLPTGPGDPSACGTAAGFRAAGQKLAEGSADEKSHESEKSCERPPLQSQQEDQEKEKRLQNVEKRPAAADAPRKKVVEETQHFIDVAEGKIPVPFGAKLPEPAETLPGQEDYDAIFSQLHWAALDLASSPDEHLGAAFRSATLVGYDSRSWRLMSQLLATIESGSKDAVRALGGGALNKRLGQGVYPWEASGWRHEVLVEKLNFKEYSGPVVVYDTDTFAIKSAFLPHLPCGLLADCALPRTKTTSESEASSSCSTSNSAGAGADEKPRANTNSKASSFCASSSSNTSPTTLSAGPSKGCSGGGGSSTLLSAADRFAFGHGIAVRRRVTEGESDKKGSEQHPGYDEVERAYGMSKFVACRGGKAAAGGMYMFGSHLVPPYSREAFPGTVQRYGTRAAEPDSKDEKNTAAAKGRSEQQGQHRDTRTEENAEIAVERENHSEQEVELRERDQEGILGDESNALNRKSQHNCSEGSAACDRLPRNADVDEILFDFAAQYAHAERLLVPAAARSRLNIMRALDPDGSYSLIPGKGHAAANGAHIFSKSREYVVMVHADSTTDGTLEAIYFYRPREERAGVGAGGRRIRGWDADRGKFPAGHSWMFFAGAVFNLSMVRGAGNFVWVHCSNPDPVYHGTLPTFTRRAGDQVTARHDGMGAAFLLQDNVARFLAHGYGAETRDVGTIFHNYKPRQEAAKVVRPGTVAAGAGPPEGARGAGTKSKCRSYFSHAAGSWLRERGAQKGEAKALGRVQKAEAKALLRAQREEKSAAKLAAVTTAMKKSGAAARAEKGGHTLARAVLEELEKIENHDDQQQASSASSSASSSSSSSSAGCAAAPPTIADKLQSLRSVIIQQNLIAAAGPAGSFQLSPQDIASFKDDSIESKRKRFPDIVAVLSEKLDASVTSNRRHFSQLQKTAGMLLRRMHETPWQKEQSLEVDRLSGAVVVGREEYEQASRQLLTK